MAQTSITTFTNKVISETQFSSRTLSDSITSTIANVNKELATFPTALDNHLMTCVREIVENVDARCRRAEEYSRRAEENSYRRFFNAHTLPGRYLRLHPHAVTGLPVVLPRQGYWADGVTSQKIDDANGDQINKLIHIMGVMDLAAMYGATGDEERKTYIRLHLGIRGIQAITI